MTRSDAVVTGFVCLSLKKAPVSDIETYFKKQAVYNAWINE